MQSLQIQSGKGQGRNTLLRIYQIDGLIRSGRYPNVLELAQRQRPGRESGQSGLCLLYQGNWACRELLM